MQELNAIKDGKGNIVINEDSFDFLLTCLDSQKFKPAQQEQDIIDEYNHQCRDILNQRYIFETCMDGYYLFKKYIYQDDIIPWSSDDLFKINELFKNTKLKNKSQEFDNEHTVSMSEQSWLIERPLRYDNDYLTISEDMISNRKWTIDEIENIIQLFDGYTTIGSIHLKEKLWKNQLSNMDINIIESFIRKNKIGKLS